MDSHTLGRELSRRMTSRGIQAIYMGNGLSSSLSQGFPLVELGCPIHAPSGGISASAHRSITARKGQLNSKG